jgi:hypothetical protein
MDERGLYPIYDYWHVPFWQTTLFKAAIGIMAGIGIVLLLVVLYKRYWQKWLSPAQIALNELAQLGKTSILTSDQAQASYFALTALLKRFFERSYHRPYQGMTDAQMMDALKETNVPADQQALLQTVVDASAGVKYARQDMMQEQFVRHIATCTNLIKSLMKADTKQ